MNAMEMNPQTTSMRRTRPPAKKIDMDGSCKSFVTFGKGAMNLACALLPKPLPVFNRTQKCFDHFRVDVVPVELVQLCQPEVVARVVRVRRIVRVPAQVTEVLRQHKRPIRLGREQI